MNEIGAVAVHQVGAAANSPSPGVEPVRFTLAKGVVVKSMPHGGAAQSIHALRTHLMARHIAEGCRALAICTTAHAGSTFLAANLAISLADAGVRTLLVDTDLRAPEINDYIQPSHELPGLADAIEQDSTPLGAAMQQVSPQLSLLYAGMPRDNSVELLGTAKFARIIDLCMREFDFTIAVTAPSNRSADARRVASLMRSAAVLARRDVTFLGDVETLIGELTSDAVQVIGTVYLDF